MPLAELQFIAKLHVSLKMLNGKHCDWTVDDVMRFTSLLKIDTQLAEIITTYQIDGQKLFDVEYLADSIQASLNEITFMPTCKLFMVVSELLADQKGKQDDSLVAAGCMGTSLRNVAQQSTRSKDIQNSRSKDSQSKHTQKATKRLPISNYALLNIQNRHITSITEELLKLNDTPVIQLSIKQVVKILRKMHMIEEAQLCQRLNVDGFTLVCILADDDQLPNLGNYFTEEQIRLLNRLSIMFLPQYYRQMKGKMSITGPSVPKEKVVTKEPRELGDEWIVQLPSIDLNKAEISTGYLKPCLELDKSGKDDGTESQSKPQHASFAESVNLPQQRGSIVQSVRNSIANSVYAQSEIADSLMCTSMINGRGSNRDGSNVRVSSIEDHTTAQALRIVAMSLPFNLLNMEPLQFIKVAAIPYPFVFNREKRKESKPESENGEKREEEGRGFMVEEYKEVKTFHLSGVKLGRNQENDFRYPDELSISGRHVQIIFKNDSYYIRDLGSKTGTFMYVSHERPLVLVDDQSIQLSNQVEIKVKILKKDKNEGVIKLQFKRPEDEPAYKASLKNKNTIRIGKSQNCHIKLANHSISSKHAEIKYEEGAFLLYDCLSSTGTWLRLSPKGVRSRDLKMQKGDIFRISAKKAFIIEDVTSKLPDLPDMSEDGEQDNMDPFASKLSK